MAYLASPAAPIPFTLNGAPALDLGAVALQFNDEARRLRFRNFGDYTRAVVIVHAYRAEHSSAVRDRYTLRTHYHLATRRERRNRIDTRLHVLALGNGRERRLRSVQDALDLALAYASEAA